MRNIVWIRNDFREEDNPALSAALESGAPTIALFIWSKAEEKLGARSRAWLVRALKQVPNIVFRKGEVKQVLGEVQGEWGATHLYYNRCYEPEPQQKEFPLDMKVKSFEGNVLFEPGTILNRQGQPFRVFTPFWNVLQKLEPQKPLSAKKGLLHLRSDPLPAYYEESLWRYWEPTEQHANKLVDAFIRDTLANYEQTRDFPALSGTSKLSSYLHFGHISVRVLWHKIAEAGGMSYLRELAWREFAIHLLYHFPEMAAEPLDRRFVKFPWEHNKKQLLAWQEGKTGYPIVDAGMRELKETGWMHSRVRMIVASFLVKHLLISWQEGAEWFWQMLVDADLANNSMNWQWVAGSGPDAAPYFRIFNPVLQGEKFDPDGEYVRRFVPELAKVPKKYIHAPWNYTEVSYVPPIVDHKQARERALRAFQSIR